MDFNKILPFFNSRIVKKDNKVDGLKVFPGRELHSLLGYSDWRNFISIVNKAKESCINVGIDPNYHFVDVNKMINFTEID